MKRPSEAQKKQFEATFEVRLSDYWDYLTGFRIGLLDKLCIEPQASEGESMRDVVRRVYGDDAVNLILDLINIR